MHEVVKNEYHDFRKKQRSYNHRNIEFSGYTFNYHDAKTICLGTVIKILDQGALRKRLNNFILKYRYSFQQAWKPEERHQYFKEFCLALNM